MTLIVPGSSSNVIEFRKCRSQKMKALQVQKFGDVNVNDLADLQPAANQVVNSGPNPFCWRQWILTAVLVMYGAAGNG